MDTQHSPLEALKIRKSDRTFKALPLEETTLNLINETLINPKKCKGPFGSSFTFQLVPVTKNVTSDGLKVGTYGIIKNPQGYLVGTCVNNKQSLVEYGYVFERFIIFLTQMGVGTCWLGGTFTRDQFEKSVHVKEGEFIPAITPVGYTDVKPRFLDSAMRYLAKSDHKKPWSELFFHKDFTNELTEEVAGSYSEAIEMVRLGPSASNKQPWRILLSEDEAHFHFYLERTPKYSSRLSYDIQYLDMGIAMYHFDKACKERKLNGHWIQEEPLMDYPNENYEYIASWKK